MGKHSAINQAHGPRGHKETEKDTIDE